tara:strand:+ start:3903 stop:4469 length:567 start_codon:yes stop_codon:yes gene_type:complete
MIVIDDFIKDQSLLDEISNSPDFFGPNGDFMWWDGWWNSPTDTLKKRIIQQIFKFNPLITPKLSEDIKKCAGFEYWTGKYGPEEKYNNLDMHMDKDELAWENHEKFVAPVIGCIYYPMNTMFDGGMLQLEHYGVRETFLSKFNRLIMFQTGQITHGVTQVFKGTRHAFAINLFHEELEASKLNQIKIE